MYSLPAGSFDTFLIPFCSFCLLINTKMGSSVDEIGYSLGHTSLFFFKKSRRRTNVRGGDVHHNLVNIVSLEGDDVKENLLNIVSFRASNGTMCVRNLHVKWDEVSEKLGHIVSFRVLAGHTQLYYSPSFLRQHFSSAISTPFITRATMRLPNMCATRMPFVISRSGPKRYLLT